MAKAGKTSVPAPTSPLPSCIDGERALGHIERLVALGPRHAGTPGLEQARQLIIDTLRGFGLSPKRHDFTARTPHPELAEVPMANISVDFPAVRASDPDAKMVLIGGHFDGKLLTGVEFKGANDGGSSTGLLLELARCLAAHPPPVPVRLAWFDGEESILEWSDSDSLYGSKRMAYELVSSGEHRRIAAAVIVDMVGDPNLRIERETLSTPWVMAVLRRSASRLGYGELMRGRQTGIEDDHVPLLRIGVPAAVLIDLQYGPGWDSNAWWHTAKDDLDRVSPASMAAVGRIVLEALPDLPAGPPERDAKAGTPRP
ncbi:MAG TPA: M28 family peptidase [Polyangia bacterium]|nr:M28 family peptidase [Polyangia bacterium]